MPALSFRLKLLLAMMLVVVGVTGSTLFVSQQRSQRTYEEMSSGSFRDQARNFSEQQQLVLDSIKQTCVAIAGSVRLQSALQAAQEGGEARDLYDRAGNELEARQALRTTVDDPSPLHAVFFIFIDTAGTVIPPSTNALAGFKPLDRQNALKIQLAQASQAIARMEEPLAGYVTPETEQGDPALHQAVFTRVVNTATGDVLGALVLGFPIANLRRQSGSTNGLKGGIWFEDRLYSSSLSESEATLLRDALAQRIGKNTGSEDWTLSIAGDPHRVFYQALNPDPALPRGFLVSMFSGRAALQAQRENRDRFFTVGAVGLAFALIASLFLSHGLSVPIRELVAGTAEIQRGNFDVKVPVRTQDELGRLANSFNDMAVGLALKEKYRSVLDKVADKEVATELMNGNVALGGEERRSVEKYRSVLDKVADKEVATELMNGNVALGGEEREISVLFCDIRGFTALTQGMEPAEVIRMLNEHFTPLTRVVNKHRGVVDKFVGDLIMAVFGAPKSYGNDAVNASRCALEMIRERRQLNETSHYRIEMGIGLASGPALAGCMGSEDRLNYTVLGTRVNLASRLCSKAGRMEVVIDETTRARLGDVAEVEALAELELKGFTGRVPAFKLVAFKGTEKV